MDAGFGKLILATASVLVIEFGAAVMSHAGDVGEAAPNSSWDRPASSGPSQRPQAVADLSKEDIRQAQVEVRHAGLLPAAAIARHHCPALGYSLFPPCMHAASASEKGIVSPRPTNETAARNLHIPSLRDSGYTISEANNPTLALQILERE
jgi:hypothetical protein